jgi:ribonuclease E
MRALITAASREEIEHLTVEVEHEVADYLSNRKRREINSLEDECHLTISIRARTDVTPNHIVIDARDSAGHQFRIPIPGDSQSGR